MYDEIRRIVHSRLIPVSHYNLLQVWTSMVQRIGATWTITAGNFRNPFAFEHTSYIRFYHYSQPHLDTYYISSPARHMEINFFGQVSVTKQALPLLKKSARTKGHSARIINITSFSGLLPGLPMKSGSNLIIHGN